jgi:hypothetical protein
MTDLTVGAGHPRVQYVANGSQTAFTYPFPVYAGADLAVWFGDGAAPGSFSVSGVGQSAGGTVTFAAAPPSGTRITILRAMAVARGTDFQEGGEFRAAAINEELDRLAMMVQQVDEKVARAVHLRPHAVPAATDLPPPAPGFLRWNGDGTALVLDAVPQAVADAAAASAASAAASEAAVVASATAAATSAGTASSAAGSAGASATSSAGSAAAAAASASAAASSASAAAASAAAADLPTERKRSDLARLRERVRAIVDPLSACQPALGVDFVQALGLDHLSFSRAATATFFDAFGVLRSAAIDTPRYDHDPATGAPRGLLLETQRSNLLLRSAELDLSPWTPADCTITANAAMAPDGTTAAERLVESATNAAHNLAQGFTASAAILTFSIFARAAGRSEIVLEVSRAGVGEAVARFDLAAGSVVASAGSHHGFSRIEAVGGGWFRCAVTTAALTAATWQAIVRPYAGADVYTGDGSGLFLWGAQAEAGAFASSYIATAAATVTRAADLASILTAGFAFNAAEWSLFVHAATAVVAPAGTNFGIVAFSNGGGAELAVLQAQNIGRVTLNVTDSSVLVASLETANSYPAITPWRAAARFRADDFALALNGGAVVADTSGGLPTIDRLLLGRQPNGQDLERGWLRSLLVFPRALGNTHLQALTA